MLHATEIQVMGSAAFKEAYVELAPQFERSSGHKIVTSWITTSRMRERLKAGETTDLALLPAAMIDELAKLGVIAQRFDIATCSVAAAVRAGAPKPDLSSGEALKRAVLNASSIVYSMGPSGVYLAGLFQRMGIADEIRPKVKQISGEPTGALVARGEAELGFQQLSELLPVAGIDIVGPLPPDVQETTMFSAGLHAKAAQPEAARALVDFLKAPGAKQVWKVKGLEPV